MVRRYRFTERELNLIVDCLLYALARPVRGGPLEPDETAGLEGTKLWRRLTDQKFRLANSASLKARSIITAIEARRAARQPQEKPNA